MALDLTLPATGVTKFGDLYAALRANFVALDAAITNLEDSFEVEAWTDVTLFETGWTIGSDHVSWMKDPFGFVHLRGTLEAGATAGQLLFTLPADYRPEQSQSYIATTSLNTAPSLYVTVGTDGHVHSSMTVNGSFVFLSGITFKAA